MTGGDDGTTRLWSVATGASLATLVSYTDGSWAVVDFASRFDTDNLEGAGALHWILDSEQMRALPLEIFMRNYYQPHLLPRLEKCLETDAARPGACMREFGKVARWRP